MNGALIAKIRMTAEYANLYAAGADEISAVNVYIDKRTKKSCSSFFLVETMDKIFYSWDVFLREIFVGV